MLGDQEFTARLSHMDSPKELRVAHQSDQLNVFGLSFVVEISLIILID